MRLNCILQDLFRDTLLDHIWHAQISAQIWPNTAKYAKYGIWGAYLGTTNLVKLGIPEKILQNVSQTRWPCVNRTPQSKVMTKFIFDQFPHCNYNVKLQSGSMNWFWSIMLTKNCGLLYKRNMSQTWLKEEANNKNEPTYSSTISVVILIGCYIYA